MSRQTTRAVERMLQARVWRPSRGFELACVDILESGSGAKALFKAVEALQCSAALVDTRTDSLVRCRRCVAQRDHLWR